MLKHLLVLKTDRRGATAIEYGLIAVGVSIAIAGVVFTIGGSLFDTFTEVANRLNGAG